jgi:hypothetical protein
MKRCYIDKEKFFFPTLIKLLKISNEHEETLLREQYKPLTLQDWGKEVPCPLGKDIGECQLIALLQICPKEHVQFLLSVLQYHLFLWHSAEVMNLAFQKILSLMTWR